MDSRTDIDDSIKNKRKHLNKSRDATKMFFALIFKHKYNETTSTTNQNINVDLNSHI